MRVSEDGVAGRRKKKEQAKIWVLNVRKGLAVTHGKSVVDLLDGPIASFMIGYPCSGRRNLFGGGWYGNSSDGKRR